MTAELDSRSLIFIVELCVADVTSVFEVGCNKLLVIVNVRNHSRDLRIDHIDRALGM